MKKRKTDKMLIGIDGNEANIEKKVGVNQYAYGLLKNIYDLQEKSKPIRFVVYLKDKPREDLPKQKPWWKYKVIPGRGLWIITKLMPHLFSTKEKPDVFFTPSHYLPPASPMPKVSTIHDLGYLKFSGQFKKYDFWQLTIWTAISVFVSKAIIAVSNSTKRDIVRHYPFASKKIAVVHHGYDQKRFNQKISQKDVRRIKKRYSIVNDYVLFIGTLKPSKNIEGLLTAWKVVLGKFSKLKLVIAGKKGWLYESIFEKVDQLGLKESVIFTDFIPEEDKPGLIAGAKVFVLPSFWEGFGLDVINAMACGTPAVVSNIASLPEVAGPAGVYLNPNKIESIAQAIIKVFDMNEVKYDDLVKRGLKQAKKFSWQEAARATLATIVAAGSKK